MLLIATPCVRPTTSAALRRTRPLVEPVPALADLERKVGGLVAAAVAEREHHLEQLLLHARRDARDHAQVEQRDLLVGREEHVAGVRIGVEEAVDEDLLEIRAEELVGDRRPVDLEQRHRADVGDLPAVDEIHRQDAPRAVILHRPRDDDAVEARERVRQRRQVARFLVVIQLGEQRLPEFGDDAAELVLPTHGGPVIEHRRDLRHRVQVLDDARVDVRALDLHDHRTAIAQGRAMHLPQRCRCLRLALEGQERLADLHAELFLDDPLDVLVRERRDVVLKAGERLEIARREKFAAGREHLAQLHIGGTQALEVRGQLLGLRRDGDRVTAAGAHRDVLVQAGFPDDIAAPVLEEQHRNILVPLQMRRLQ
jgi:hypothetical protein